MALEILTSDGINHEKPSKIKKKTTKQMIKNFITLISFSLFPLHNFIQNCINNYNPNEQITQFFPTFKNMHAFK